MPDSLRKDFDHVRVVADASCCPSPPRPPPSTMDLRLFTSFTMAARCSSVTFFSFRSSTSTRPVLSKAPSLMIHSFVFSGSLSDVSPHCIVLLSDQPGVVGDRILLVAMSPVFFSILPVFVFTVKTRLRCSRQLQTSRPRRSAPCAIARPCSPPRRSLAVSLPVRTPPGRCIIFIEKLSCNVCDLITDLLKNLSRSLQHCTSRRNNLS